MDCFSCNNFRLSVVRCNYRSGGEKGLSGAPFFVPIRQGHSGNRLAFRLGKPHAAFYRNRKETIKSKNMKWLKIADIKKQLRVDFDDEDDVLELYGSAAEDTVLSYLNRTYQDVLEEYGEVPVPIRQATLMLVDNSYQHRSPAEPTQIYYVLYGFDMLVKPYMRLTDSDTCPQRVNTYTIGSQIKILIESVLPDNLRLPDVDFDVVVYNDDKKDQQKKYKKTECILTDESDYVVLLDSDELGVGTYMVKLTVYIPDTDFSDGKRKEVVRINPNVKVTG